MSANKYSIQHFFDPDTFTLTYVVFDSSTLDGIIIDPVLDFDPASGAVSDTSLKPVVHFIKTNNLKIHASLETHAHADHLSSSQILKQIYPQIKIGISERIKIVQEVFKSHFNLTLLKADGSQFDLLLKDGQSYSFGSIQLEVIPTPGHTPACTSFKIGQNVFTGDALFMPDSGTGRCDFPRGSAQDLYQSITKNIYSLDEDTKIYVGHDYSPGGRPLQFQTTVGESKANNTQLKAHTAENEFIKFRQERDQSLKAPRLLFPSVQINIDAGHLAPQESNGKTYLKIPLTVKTELGKL